MGVAKRGKFVCEASIDAGPMGVIEGQAEAHVYK